MTRREIVTRAAAGLITWAVAATVLGFSERHMRRVRDKYERVGIEALEDGRDDQPPSLITVASRARARAVRVPRR